LDRKFLSVLLILIPLVATCACIGGDENVEKWNEIVEKANGYAEDGGDILEEAEDAYGLGNYDIALNKADEASGKFDLLLGEIDELMDVAEDMDNGFTEDYVEAWESKVEAGQSYIDNLKMLILIDKFGAIFQVIMDSEETAFDQMYDMNDYYNGEKYQLALTTADMAYNNFGQLVSLAEDLDSVAQDIGTDYVIQYTTAIKSLYTNCMTFIEYARLACSAAISNDLATADNYVDQANVYYNNASEAQTALEQAIAAHPSEFPVYGTPLDGIYNSYYSDLSSDLEDVGDYDDEMNDIKEDNDDFFED